MGGELFKNLAGIDTLFVPYNGDPASLTDLAGGRIEYTFTKGFGEFLDQTILTSGGKEQAEIKPFTVTMFLYEVPQPQ